MIEIKRGWLEELLKMKREINLNQIAPIDMYPFSGLLGFIESAKYLLDETPKAE